MAGEPDEAASDCDPCLAGAAAPADGPWSDAATTPPPTGRSPVLELFDDGRLVKCAAPMVRYSKLPFRTLLRRWGCDLIFSPMIVAKDFCASPRAREKEFVTNTADRPLVVQFGASSADEFGRACEFVVGRCDAIDLNCGCPQRWAISDGIGSGLLKKPETIRDMVRRGRETSNLPVSVKIRIDTDLRTVEIARLAEAMGVSWITVHGRTPRQRSSEPVNLEAIKLVRESVSVPVVANGSIDTLADAERVRASTGVHGVMSARGILANPAAFAGYEATPTECVRDWVDISMQLGDTLYLHQHLMFMLFSSHQRQEKKEFNAIKSAPGILDYLRRQGVLD